MTARKRKNPFKVIERVLEVTGYILLGLLAVGIVAIWVALIWIEIGAWALLAPIVIPGGLILLGFLIMLPLHMIGYWWNKAKNKWEAKTR